MPTPLYFSLLVGLLLYLFFYPQGEQQDVETALLAGAVDGSFSISNDGSSSYDINIAVPPGTKNMQPELSVTYNSKAGNGMLGMGWSLQGLPTIERTAATLAQDGFVGTVNYDANDRFALNGQRLILVKDYGDSSLYHTEVESWKKVMSYGNASTGPDSFCVLTKKGYRVEYGFDPSAQIKALGQEAISVWALNKISDLNGNTLNVSYLNDSTTGAYYPLVINYTANEIAEPKLTAQRQVIFSYDSLQTSRVDTVPEFQGGSPISETKRLSNITTFVNGAAILDYQFYYSYSVYTGRSILDSIKECSVIENACLPATTFTYQDGDNTLLPADTLLMQDSMDYTQNLPMDVNGDGLTDLVSISGYPGAQNGLFEYRIFHSRGDGFEQPVGEVLENLYYPYEGQGAVRSMDVNGDGKSDLAYAFQNANALEYVVLLSAGSSFYIALDTVITNVQSPLADPSVIPMDANGDGYSDLVYVYGNNSNEKLQCEVLLTQVGELDGQEVITMELFSVTTDLPCNTDLPMITGANINGDAMGDLVYVYTEGNAMNIVSLTSADSASVNNKFFSQYDSIQIDGNLDYFNIAAIDVNGDGLSDLNCTWSGEDSDIISAIYFSNGRSFLDSPASLDTFSNLGGGVLMPAELNGDGHSDIILARQVDELTEYITYLSNGFGFELLDTISPANFQWGQNLILDINGDSKSDILYIPPAYGYDAVPLVLIPSSDKYPDLLATIENGIGGKIDLTYQTMTDTLVYQSTGGGSPATYNGPLLTSKITGSSSTFGQSVSSGSIGNINFGAVLPFSDAVMPSYLVSAYAKHDGRGNSYHFGYQYTDAKVDLRGRGWLGFATKTQVDSSANTRSLSAYHQIFPFTGAIDSSQVFTLDNHELLTKSQSLYQDSMVQVNNGQGALYSVVQSATKSTQYDYGEFAFSITKEYAYDPYGNMTKQIDYGTADSTLYRINTYDNDTTLWQLGYITSSKASRDENGNDVLVHQKVDYQSNSR